jgi:hypothetical protein
MLLCKVTSILLRLLRPGTLTHSFRQFGTRKPIYFIMSPQFWTLCERLVWEGFPVHRIAVLLQALLIGARFVREGLVAHKPNHFFFTFDIF